MVAGGCNRNGDAPVEVPIDQASTGVKTTFATAPEDVRKAAEAAAQSMQSGEYVESYSKIEQLSVQTDLTPEQRQALGESQAAVLKKLNEAAVAGNEAAAKALEAHRSRK